MHLGQKSDLSENLSDGAYAMDHVLQFMAFLENSWRQWRPAVLEAETERKKEGSCSTAKCGGKNKELAEPKPVSRAGLYG